MNKKLLSQACQNEATVREYQELLSREIASECRRLPNGTVLRGSIYCNRLSNVNLAQACELNDSDAVAQVQHRLELARARLDGLGSAMCEGWAREAPGSLVQ